MADNSLHEIPLVAGHPSLLQNADELARKWGLQRRMEKTGDQYILYLTPQRLELRSTTGEHGPVFVDFTQGAMAYRRQHGGGRKQPLARAVGLKQNACPTILDATAGLGRDAFVFATLGSKVTLVERSPVIAALLADGIERAQVSGVELDFLHDRFKLEYGNAVQVIAGLDARQAPDVVYIDPMYPDSGKSAGVKKEMAALRYLLGKDVDASDILDIALGKARKRVVVKRPGYAAWLGNRKPDAQVTMQKHRFDVYLLEGKG